MSVGPVQADAAGEFRAARCNVSTLFAQHVVLSALLRGLSTPFARPLFCFGLSFAPFHSSVPLRHVMLQTHLRLLGVPFARLIVW